MAVRKDGLDTYKKLLKAASEVFAEKGYRDATIAEICRRAQSNVAAVNYHFGSKDELYIAVWKNAFEEALRIYPPDGGLPPDASNGSVTSTTTETIREVLSTWPVVLTTRPCQTCSAPAKSALT